MDRFTIVGRGVVVVGERIGGFPEVGQPVVIRDGDHTVMGIVGGLERFQHRGDDKFSGHSWGLLLEDVTPDDVRIGSVVSGVEDLPDALTLDEAFRAAFYLVLQYLEVEKKPSDALALYAQYLWSDPARWSDWRESVRRALSDGGGKPQSRGTLAIPV